MIIGENKLLDYIVKNWGKIFPRSYKLVEKRPQIHGCLTGNIIGQGDILFERGNQLYLAELKYGQDDSTDLWNSFKVIAYAKMAHLRTARKVKPIVFLKKSIVTNEIAILIESLEMGYATFELKGGEFEFEFLF